MAAQPAQYSAFISYATADGGKAQEICARLEGDGLRCWIAPRDVRAGREYANEIINGIERSQWLVLVLSAAANESQFVRREVERAVTKGRPVIPVRIEPVLPSAGLELFVSGTHWIDAWSGDWAVHMDRLVRDLTEGPSAAALSPARSAFRSRSASARWTTRRLSYGAAALGLAAVITVLEYRDARDGEAQHSADPAAAPANPQAPAAGGLTSAPSKVLPPPIQTRENTPSAAPAAHQTTSRAHVTDQDGINAALQQYVTAYQSRDPAALRGIWPSMPASLAPELVSARSYRLQLVDPQVTIDKDSATVTCIRRISYLPDVGRERSASPPTVIVLQREPPGWIIKDVR